MRPLLRTLLILAGTLCVVLAAVGMFLPILPTTPFLLLAAACYARSSERFLHWLLHNRYFGQYIRNYRDGLGMPASTKILTLITLWLTLGLSAILAVSSWPLRLLLAGVGIGVTIHLARLKTYRPPDGRAVADLHPTSAPSEEP